MDPGVHPKAAPATQLQHQADVVGIKCFNKGKFCTHAVQHLSCMLAYSFLNVAWESQDHNHWSLTAKSWLWPFYKETTDHEYCTGHIKVVHCIGVHITLWLHMLDTCRHSLRANQMIQLCSKRMNAKLHCMLLYFSNFSSVLSGSKERKAHPREATWFYRYCMSQTRDI